MKKLIITLLALSATALGKNELYFPTPTVDVFVHPNMETMTIKFPFVNNSSKTLKLEPIKVLCTCTTAVYKDDKKTMAPGEQGEIIATLKPGMLPGSEEKGLHVSAGGSTYKLSMRVNIPEIVKITPLALEWKKGEALTPKIITITVDPNYPLKITTAKMTTTGSEQTDFNFDPKVITPMKEYRITVTPKSTGKKLFRSMWIQTDSKNPRYAQFLVALRIS